MTECHEGDGLNQEIFDAFGELIARVMARGEKLAEDFGVPLFTVKAMHWLGDGMAMKELGRRMRCDPSFVTAIADSLEKHGLARREPNPADRRIKNLVLTPEGRDLKERLEREMLARMPWCTALDLDERKALLALVRKLVNAERPATSGPSAPATPPLTGGESTGEVTGELRTASAGANLPAKPVRA
ncbi:MAG TPA: MarR family transcriptional regulator [Streptosporangiaceae bacterium]|nr:MarR family transcriptional regulator [Streptosporangiaceae bacterium]